MGIYVGIYPSKRPPEVLANLFTECLVDDILNCPNK